MVIENSGFSSQHLAEKAMKAQLDELTGYKTTTSVWYIEGRKWGYTIIASAS
jgi:hypothetical protein